MSEIELIQHIFDEVSPFVAQQYEKRGGLEIRSKRNVNDWLTAVDEEVQRQIVKIIGEGFPDDVVVGEELGMSELPEDGAARFWLVDPIDGTQNFVRGMFPMFGVSVAFVRDSVVQAAGVRMPQIDATFLAQHGGGATRNGKRIRTGDTARLDHARIEVDLGNHPARSRAMAMFPDVMLHAGQVRCVCAAVVGLCSVACADADGYFCAGLNPWDYAAAMLIVEEAGGRVTRLDGAPVDLFDGRWGMLATNGPLHEEGLRAIRPLPETHPVDE